MNLKCGIIGFGKMGRIRARSIEENNFGEIIAIYDPDQQEIPYNRVDNDYEVINDPEVEVVFVCTPNYRIAPLCKDGLLAGKHVFAEKPPAFNAKELLEVIEIENISGKKLMYGFNHRHHGSIKKMKSMIESGEIGNILWMRGRYGKEVDQNYFKGWRADPKLAGGGILLDQGIHMLDLFLHLAGSFDEVYSLVSNLYWKAENLEDNVFAIMRNNNSGVCASLHSTMTQWRYLFSLEVFFSKGSMVLNGLRTSSGVYGDEILSIKKNSGDIDNDDSFFPSEENFEFEIDKSWDNELKHFFEAISNDTSIKTGNSKDALALMRLIDEIYQNKTITK